MNNFIYKIMHFISEIYVFTGADKFEIFISVIKWIYWNTVSNKKKGNMNNIKFLKTKKNVQNMNVAIVLVI